MTWSTRFLAVSWGAFVVGLLGWVCAGVYVGFVMPANSGVASVGMGWGIFSGTVGLIFAGACMYRGGIATFPALVNAGLIIVGGILLASAAFFFS